MVAKGSERWEGMNKGSTGDLGSTETIFYDTILEMYAIMHLPKLIGLYNTKRKPWCMQI